MIPGLDSAIEAKLCVTASGTGADVEVTLSNTKVGHGFPSGSNQDALGSRFLRMKVRL